MPGRITPLSTGYYYHVFNRGADERNIFKQEHDFNRFLQTIKYYQSSEIKPRLSLVNKEKLQAIKVKKGKKLVDIICYCLMPNHFHLLIYQQKDNGISLFISKLANSYTRFFNTKYKRVGALFQGAFKAVLVENDDQFIHLSRYIHLNPVVSRLTKNLLDYRWSSTLEYISGKQRLCTINKVLELFPSKKKYRRFLEDQIDYGTTLEIIKHRAIDNIDS